MRATKIKEAIKQYEEHIQYRLSVEDCNAIDTIIEAVEFYESQDLIPRNDVLGLHDSKDDYCNEKCEYYDRSEPCYMRCIPKAEPPFASDTNVARNGSIV